MSPPLVFGALAGECGTPDPAPKAPLGGATAMGHTLLFFTFFKFRMSQFPIPKYMDLGWPRYFIPFRKQDFIENTF